MLMGDTGTCQAPPDFEIPTAPALNRTLSDPQLPPYYKDEELVLGPADNQFQRNATRSKSYSCASEKAISHDMRDFVRAKIEYALLSRSESFFDGSLFAKAVNDMLQSTDGSSIGNSSSRIRNDDDLDNVRSFSSKVKQVDQQNVHHEISAIQTLFGTVWFRTSTTRAGGHAKSPKGLYVVNSFVYYPSWWLTNLGLRYGVEANFGTSPSGWQFCLNPIRAVPDNSLVFDFCKTGNIEGVQRLISRGDASVCDASSKGWTPLHVSRRGVVFCSITSSS